MEAFSGDTDEIKIGPISKAYLLAFINTLII